jgi:hypothetical protein
MFIAFCMIIFPMLAFGMIGGRYMILFNAANMAGQAASKSSTFIKDYTSSQTTYTKFSACHAAQNAAYSAVMSGLGSGGVFQAQTPPAGSGTATNPITFNVSSQSKGVTLSTVTVSIMSKLVGTKPTVAANVPPAVTTAVLAAGQFNSQYIYFCRVTIVGQIAPVMPSLTLFGLQVPFMSAAVPVTTVANYCFEPGADLTN